MPPSAPSNFRLRPALPGDRSEIAGLICVSLNFWYQTHGGHCVFPGGPPQADVFFAVYETLEPGHCVVAEDEATGRLAGSCFYHPRPTHVSLGIMNVHPNYFGRGVASALLRFITDFTDRGGYPALRLISSAGNLDSFSLYNRAGFVPRAVFQDMVVRVPAEGLPHTVPGLDRVRPATPADVPAMEALEREAAGITRGGDYAFLLANRNGIWDVTVYEGDGGVEGYLAASSHAALPIVGPGVSRTEEAAAALLLGALDRYRGRTPLFILPVERRGLLSRAYQWGARNVELHLCQVRGEFQPFRGVAMPTFLLETA
jgi:GNAT superfamily N-acetyltransferase